MDLSAGGARRSSLSKHGADAQAGAGGETEFRKGQFMGVRFTPMPYETPLMFSAQIRNVLPTADRTGLCIGLQIVGLEASEEGREVLGRLTKVVEHYHKVNQISGTPDDARMAEGDGGCVPGAGGSHARLTRQGLGFVSCTASAGGPWSGSSSVPGSENSLP